MGRPKQLLPFAGRSLVRRAAEAAIDSGCSPAVVVLGAHADALRPELHGLPVDVLMNDAWHRGIGTSIRCAIAHLLAMPNVPPAALLMLCDQPLVTADVLCRLVIAHAQSGKPVTVSAYNDTLGPPVIVAREYFPALLDLPDAQGAKRLWLDHPLIINPMPCTEAAMDVDSPADYGKLLANAVEC